MPRYTSDWADSDLRCAFDFCSEFAPYEGSLVDFLRVVYSESGARASALNDNPKKRRNARGEMEDVPVDERYNAAGINQNVPFILKGMGFRPADGARARAEAFCRLSTGDQLPYVRRYFSAHKGQLVNLTSWYLANFLPAHLKYAADPEHVLGQADDPGKPRTFSGKVFEANAGFDRDGDRKIQVRELGEAVLRNCVGPRWIELEVRARELLGMPAPEPPPPPSTVDLRTWAGAQWALKELGFYPSAVDGIWGPVSARSLALFQAANPPLLVDGVYGPATRAVLSRVLAARGKLGAGAELASALDASGDSSPA